MIPPFHRSSKLVNKNWANLSFPYRVKKPVVRVSYGVRGYFRQFFPAEKTINRLTLSKFADIQGGAVDNATFNEMLKTGAVRRLSA